MNPVRTYNWTQDGNMYQAVFNFNYNILSVKVNGVTLLKVSGSRALLDQYEKQVISRGRLII